MDSFGLTTFDFIVLGVVILSGLYGLVRGFTLEILSLGAWVGMVFATLYALPHVRPFAHRYIESEAAADIVAVVVIGILSLILFKLLARMAAKLVHVSGLGLLDRSLGALFGVVRGAFLVCATYLVVLWLVPRPSLPPWVTEARTQPLVEYGAGLLAQVTPAEMFGELGEVHKRSLDSTILDAVKERMPASPFGSQRGERPGYQDDERKDLERLIDRHI